MNFPVSPGDGDPSIASSSRSSRSADSFAESYQGSYLESGHSDSTGTMSLYSGSRDESISSIRSFSASSTGIAEASPASCQQEKLSGMVEGCLVGGNNMVDDVAKGANAARRTGHPPKSPSSRSLQSPHSHSNSHSLSSRSSRGHSGSSGSSNYHGSSSLQSFLNNSRGSEMSAHFSHDSDELSSQRSYSSQDSCVSGFREPSQRSSNSHSHTSSQQQLSQGSVDRSPGASYCGPSQHSYSQNSGSSHQFSRGSASSLSYRESSQNSVSNSQGSRQQLSQGSVGSNSLVSSYREPSQHSLTNSLHSATSNQQLSQGSVNSLGANQHERSQHSMTNSQNSGFPSQGSVENSSQGSSYREPSQRSLTNSQHYDSSHEQHSRDSAENNSLCSSYREPSQHSLTNSQHSGLSNDQLSRSSVGDRSDSLGSSSREPSHHSSTNSQHSQGSQQHNSVDSLGNPAPSQHSPTTSQSSRVSNQLSHGSQSRYGITELSQHSFTSSHNSALSNQLSQSDNDSGFPSNKEPSQRSSSRSSHHSGSSRLRSNRSDHSSSPDSNFQEHDLSNSQSSGLSNHLSHPSPDFHSGGSSCRESSQHSLTSSHNSALSCRSQGSDATCEGSGLSSHQSVASYSGTCSNSGDFSHSQEDGNSTGNISHSSQSANVPITGGTSASPASSGASYVSPNSHGDSSSRTQSPSTLGSHPEFFSDAESAVSQQHTAEIPLHDPSLSQGQDEECSFSSSGSESGTATVHSNLDSPISQPQQLPQYSDPSATSAGHSASSQISSNSDEIQLNPDHQAIPQNETNLSRNDDSCSNQSAGSYRSHGGSSELSPTADSEPHDRSTTHSSTIDTNHAVRAILPGSIDCRDGSSQSSSSQPNQDSVFPKNTHNVSQPSDHASRSSLSEDDQSVQSNDTWRSCQFSDEGWAGSPGGDSPLLQQSMRTPASSSGQEDLPQSANSSSSRKTESSRSPSSSRAQPVQSFDAARSSSFKKNLGVAVPPNNHVEYSPNHSQSYDSGSSVSVAKIDEKSHSSWQSGASSVARIDNSSPTSHGKYVLASASHLTSQEANISPDTTPENTVGLRRAEFVATNSSTEGSEVPIEDQSLDNVLNASIHDMDRIMNSARNVLERQMSNLALNNSESSSSGQQPSLATESSEEGQNDPYSGSQSQGTLSDQDGNWGVYESYGVDADRFATDSHQTFPQTTTTKEEDQEYNHDSVATNFDSDSSSDAESNSNTFLDHSGSSNVTEPNDDISVSTQHRSSASSRESRNALDSESQSGCVHDRILPAESDAFSLQSVGHAPATQLEASDVLAPAEPGTSASPSNRTCSVQTFVDYEIQLNGTTDAPSEGNKTVSVEYATPDLNHGDGDPGNMRTDVLESSDSNWIEGSDQLVSGPADGQSPSVGSVTPQQFGSPSSRSSASFVSSSPSGSLEDSQAEVLSDETRGRQVSHSSCCTEESSSGHDHNPVDASSADCESQQRVAIDEDWFRSADQAMSKILNRLEDEEAAEEQLQNSGVDYSDTETDLSAVIGNEASDSSGYDYSEGLSAPKQELLASKSNIGISSHADEMKKSAAIDTGWFQSADKALATITSKLQEDDNIDRQTDPTGTCESSKASTFSDNIAGSSNGVESSTTSVVDSEWLRSADEVMANMFNKLEEHSDETAIAPKGINSDERTELLHHVNHDDLPDIQHTSERLRGHSDTSRVVDGEWLRSADAVMANMLTKLQEGPSELAKAPLEEMETSIETPAGGLAIDDDWLRSADEAMAKVAAKLDNDGKPELQDRLENDEGATVRGSAVRRSSAGTSTNSAESVGSQRRTSKRSSLIPTTGLWEEGGTGDVVPTDQDGFATDRVATISMDNDWMQAADAALEKLHAKGRQDTDEDQSIPSFSSVDKSDDDLEVTACGNDTSDRESRSTSAVEESESDFEGPAVSSQDNSSNASCSTFGSTHERPNKIGGDNSAVADSGVAFPPVARLRRRLSLGGNADVFQAYQESQMESPDHIPQADPDSTSHSTSQSSTAASSVSSQEHTHTQDLSERSKSSRSGDEPTGTDWFKDANLSLGAETERSSSDTDGSKNQAESERSSRASDSVDLSPDPAAGAPVEKEQKVVIDEDWLKKADSLLTEVLGTDGTREITSAADDNDISFHRNCEPIKTTDDVGTKENVIQCKEEGSTGSNLTEDNLWDLDDLTSIVSEAKSHVPLDLSEGHSSVSDEMKSIMSNDDSLGIINEDEEDSSRASFPKTNFPVRETMLEEAKTDWKPYDEDSPSENSHEKTKQYSDDDLDSDSSSSSNVASVNWRLLGWVCLGLVLFLILLLAMPWIVRRDEDLDSSIGMPVLPFDPTLALPTTTTQQTRAPSTLSPTQPSIHTSIPTRGPVLQESTSWEQRASFDGEQGSQFGSWVSVSDDIAVIGQPLMSAFSTVRIDSNGDVLSEVGETILERIDGFGTVLSKVVNGRLVVSSLGGQVLFFLYSQFLERWQQVGNEFTGDATDEDFGVSTAVSGAFRVVVGAPKSNLIGVDGGRVYTFDYQRGIDSGWVQSDPIPLVGENPGDLFGSAVAMSDDGALLHVGATGSAEGGYVRVFLWAGISWEEICRVESESGGEAFGSSVETVSSTGDVIVVGAPNHGFDRGALRVYRIDRESGSCVQHGPDVIGEAGDRLGSPASTAGFYTGPTLSIVASTENGFIDRYELGTDNVWVRNYERLTTARTGKSTVAISTRNKQDYLMIGVPELDNVLVYVAPSLYTSTKAPTLRPVPSPIAAPSKSPVPAVIPTPPSGIAPPPPPKPILGQWIEAGGPYRIGQSDIRFGDAVALGAATMATGAPLGIGVGVVLTFLRGNDGWEAGPSQQLVGRQQGGEYGAAVEFSTDSSLLLIGAPGTFGDDGSTPQGAVFCYTASPPEGKWAQRGSMLQGSEGIAGAYEDFGMVVAASATGRVVVGAPGSSTIGSSARHGRVYVFEYDEDNQDWEETSSISGTVADELFGSAVALSGNGNFLIVGSPNVGAGFATIYQHNIFRWFPITTIDGENLGDKMGLSVEFLVDDGSLVAAGAPSSDNGRGRIVVFQRDAATGRFHQLGPALVGSAGERFGEAKRMGGSGSNPITITVGTPTGLIKQFQLQEGIWTEKLNSLDSGLRTRTGLLSLDTFGGHEVVLGGDDVTVLYEVI